MKTSKYNEIFPEKEVWRRLWEDNHFPWTEALIDRYQNKIDWVCLSANNGVIWTERMLEKYEHKLDWRRLSGGSFRGLYSSKNLKKYSSKWDWSELSTNSSVLWTMAKVEEFKEFIDWGEMISCWNSELYTLEFFEKYKEYFPVSSLQQSRLWDKILDIHKDKLIEEILAQ